MKINKVIRECIIIVMRIINIIGHSNSGKTTLIARLVPLLAEVGTVATIKHMGHHIWELPLEKDTTVHFMGGSLATAGIDAEKTVLSLRTTSVYDILDFFSWKGYDYAVVEGFKEEGFSCVVLGDIMAEHVVIRDTNAETVFAMRDLFDIYVPR
ncbi:MAG TPA: molybdopterin-guanine dinucleotide biosynthesis protein B [Methanocorpusculum sp.]|nr:molybdopterin-guanine dinucleotide biosynthesis protein B [Methanocorpusculum sp.]